MRQNHTDLLTTLRDVAATAVTMLGTFAQIRRERTAQQQWAPARKLADSINDRLFEIAELAHNAIQEDGLRTLPLLDALLERLHDEFRDRTGPFAAVPNIGLVR